MREPDLEFTRLLVGSRFSGVNLPTFQDPSPKTTVSPLTRRTSLSTLLSTDNLRDQDETTFPSVEPEGESDYLFNEHLAVESQVDMLA